MGFVQRWSFSTNFLVYTDYHRSKAQYIRQIKKWRFSKNFTSEHWRSIGRAIKEREARGKNSEVVIKQKPISGRKLRKEIGRYTLDIEEENCFRR